MSKGVKMLYSVRMRAAQGAAHEAGGRHISGAERLVSREEVAGLTQEILERAFSHSRGQADFINIIVEAVAEQTVQLIELLPISTVEVADVQTGRAAARAALLAAGIRPEAVDAGLAALLALEDSMRGAMLICAESGKRLDDIAGRGVRVSRMDIDDAARFNEWLTRQGFSGAHIREAVVLASKVAAAGVAAELCWSDDPEYTAGYVASAGGYIRFPKLKPYGSPLGGRLFFIKPGSDLAGLVNYLETQPVLAAAPKEAGEKV